MQLDFQKYGVGQTELIILHGLLGSGRNWQQIAQKLAADGGILVPTLRNHGASPHGLHSMQLMCDDLARLLDLLEIECTNLLGHSLGGMVAMRFAITYPERIRSLIVVDTAPKINLKKIVWILQRLQDVDLKNITRKKDADALLADSIHAPVIRQFLLTNLKRQQGGTYAWQCNLDELHRFVLNEPTFSLGRDEQFNGPSLFIGGGRSDLKLQLQADEIIRHFPNSRLQMIAEADHWVHFDSPEVFLHLVRDFLTTETGSARA